MRAIVEDDFKRWTVKRKAALVMDIIQGKDSIAEASRSFGLPSLEIKGWVEADKRGMENSGSLPISSTPLPVGSAVAMSVSKDYCANTFLRNFFYRP